MNNGEIKAVCPNLDATAAQLRDIDGARHAGTLHQIDTYFCVRHGRLKLRENQGDSAQLMQYLRPDEPGSRLSDYLLVATDEPEKMKIAVGRSLGVWVVVEKTRELFLWRNTRIHLDSVAGLSKFLELETVINDQSVDDTVIECGEIQKVLGISQSRSIADSYADMMAKTDMEDR